MCSTSIPVVLLIALAARAGSVVDGLTRIRRHPAPHQRHAEIGHGHGCGRWARRTLGAVHLDSPSVTGVLRREAMAMVAAVTGRHLSSPGSAGA